MSLMSFFVRPLTFWQKAPAKRHTAFEATGQIKGEVFLVGAGPGDPELITMKGYRLLQEADVVLYDALVSADLLAYIPRKTPRIFVGKRVGQHSMKQHEISDILVEQGFHGKRVVRLKGGDPSVFGRVKEEADALERAGIPFAIVPGITAASATSAYTGIPLTCRDISQSVSFSTTRRAADDGRGVHAPHGSTHNGTQIFYMGSRHLEDITRNLIDDGLHKATPVALIDQVSTQEQKILTGALNDIHIHPQRKSLKGPTLILVGEVINHQMAVDTSLLGDYARQI